MTSAKAGTERDAAELRLRPASPADERRLLEWRNDTEARQASFTEAEVSADEHSDWFRRKLADSDCCLLIIEEKGRPVGQLRLDRSGRHRADVSIAVASEHRGRGIGRAVLTMVPREASRLPGVMTVRAFVKEENRRSLAAFLAAGFREASRDGGIVELSTSARAGGSA